MDKTAEDLRYEAAHAHALSRSGVLSECEEFARFAIETQKRVSIPHAWIMFRGQEGKNRELDAG